MPNQIKPENQPPADKPRAENLGVEQKNFENNFEVDTANNPAKIISILKYLRHYDNRGALEYSPGRNSKEPWQLRDKTNNYFIQTKIAQILKEPLEDFTNEERRRLLKANWASIIAIDYLACAILPVIKESSPAALKSFDPADEAMLSAIGVEKIFELYRHNNPSFFYWHEWTNLQDRNDDERLKTNYDIVPSYRNDNHDKNEKFCYTRVNAQYGVIYNLRGVVDSFFELDPKLERQTREEINKNGEISEDHLEFFIDKFNKAQKNGNSEQFLHYLQIRNLLPKNLKTIIDEKLKLDIPKELNRNFTTAMEFRDELAKHKKQLLKNLSGGQKEKTDFLINELNALLEQRKKAAKEKYFGYASEDIELLNFFNSFNLNQPDSINPRAHHTICYYLYIRKDLPDDLVSEFESKFDIKIPENLKEFGNFDDYLTTSDQELLKPFSNYPNFQEMSIWLNQRIGNLSDKIRETKNVPKRLTLSEILEREGFGKEKMSEEKYNQLLLTYETLIELPMVEKIEQEFGINLEDYSVREQVQFVNFLSTKSVTEVEKVKQFLSQEAGETSKKNRVKTFLSLESGQDIGDKILNLGDQLENQPQTADLLFSEYARLVDSTEQTAASVEQLYNEIFFEKKIDKNEINRSILKRAGQLLLNAEKNLKNTPENDKSAMVRELVEELIREQMAQKIMLENFKAIAVKLNEKYREINLSVLSDERREEVNYTGSDNFIKSTGKVHPKLPEAIKKEQKKHKKYDSSRIKDYIVYYESQYIMSEEAEEALKSVGLNDEKIKQLREKSKKVDEPKYKPIVEKLRATLYLQIALERKLEQIIYGKTDDDEALEQSLPSAILDKYNEIVDLTKKSKRELTGLFKEEIGIQEADLSEITENILKKAKECLDYFTACVEKGETINKDEILRRLEGYQADLILQFSVRKKLAREKSIKPDDLKGVVFERKTAGELVSENNAAALDNLTREMLSDKPVVPGSSLKGMIKESRAHFKNQKGKSMDYVQQMMRMYQENYKDNPDKQPLLLEDLRDALKNGDNTVIYMYRKGNQILAFIRYEKTGEKKKFAASLNSLPSLSGFDMGMPLLASSLEMESADGSEIEGDADPYKFVTPRYIEKNGFVVKKTSVKRNNPYFKISRQGENDHYQFRDFAKFPEAEIIKLGEKKPSGTAENNFVLKFKPNAKELFETTRNFTSRGYALTRYVVKNGSAYCAFEKNAQN